MSYASYSAIFNLLKWRDPFQGNSVRAEWISGMARYCIWSYATLIWSEPENSGITYFDNRNYSVTTRKIQSMIARVCIDTWERFRTKRGPIVMKRKYLYVPRGELILDFPNDDAYLIEDTGIVAHNDGRVEGELRLPFETTKEFAF